MSSPSPKFDNPPVIETVLGIQFKPLSRWQIHHIGLYAAKMRSRYPHVQIHPPLPREIEGSGEEAGEVRISLMPMSPRCWFISGDDKWVVQVQNSKFFSNWRRVSDAKYPEYKESKEHFLKELDRFSQFLKKEDIGVMEPELVEVSYINHIDIDKEYRNLSKIFPSWSNHEYKGFLNPPSAVEIRVVFAIENEKGRLFVHAEPIVRHSDMKEVIQLTLTAKVPLASDAGDNVSNELSIAHNWVVRGFTDFTGPEMHRVWKRTQ